MRQNPKRQLCLAVTLIVESSSRKSSKALKERERRESGNSRKCLFAFQVVLLTRPRIGGKDLCI